jgi:hypothetical protein
MGSLSLINAAGGHPDINGAGNVSCLFKSGEIHYKNMDSIGDCVLTYDVGVSYLESEIFKVFPTIVEDQITIQLNVSTANFIIYNMQGKLLVQDNIQFGNNLLKLALPEGVYIIEVIGENIYRQTKRIVVI